MLSISVLYEERRRGFRGEIGYVELTQLNSDKGLYTI